MHSLGGRHCNLVTLARSETTHAVTHNLLAVATHSRHVLLFGKLAPLSPEIKAAQTEKAQDAY
jgi:hypothetical protein